jgi:hypothetical protein
MLFQFWQRWRLIRGIINLGSVCKILLLPGWFKVFKTDTPTTHPRNQWTRIIETDRKTSGRVKNWSTHAFIVPHLGQDQCITHLNWSCDRRMTTSVLKGPIHSVRLSNFTVWRHTWRKIWVNCAVHSGNRTVSSVYLAISPWLHLNLKARNPPKLTKERRHPCVHRSI